MLQVAGGAAPSTSLLALLHVLTKMASSTDHPFEYVAGLKVKALKNHTLMLSTLNELSDLGRDAASRLRKDTKFKVLADAGSHVSGNAKIFEEIVRWETEHREEMSKVAEGGVATIQILGVDVAGKIQNRALSEKDNVFTDCVEHQAAEFGNQLNAVDRTMQAVAKDMHKGGPADWTSGLADDAGIGAVVAKAAKTLLTVPMDAMKTAIASTEKAGIWRWLPWDMTGATSD